MTTSPHPAWGPQRELAAHNESAILDAARRLFRDQQVASVDIRRVARAAGVGVGTVYRRFHDKAGLLAAVIGEDERRLQDAVIAGPPPLGPGAPAEDRLAAFLREQVRLTEENLSVLIATDASAPGGRFRVGAYQAWRVHVMVLLDELRPELSEADAGWVADALLAPLDPELYDHQRRERGLTVERITENLLALAARVIRP